MPDMSAPIKLGANCWNQYTEWADFLTAQQRADGLGYDSLWTWDHLYPIQGSDKGPILECYTAMAAVASATTNATIGLMVGANTFRNPALTAKMITTIDHISDGRAVLGIGAAWFETEHTDFGIPFGESPGQRLRWLKEALPLMRGMLDGTEPSAAGEYYAANKARNLPAPKQQHLPILVGGGGPKVTLRLTAQYADACNIGGSVEVVAEKDRLLIEHCEAVGRDEQEIERTTAAGAVVIRDSREEALAVHARTWAGNGGARVPTNAPVGTPEDVFEHLAAFVALGYRHLICSFPAPHDEETMTRMATEVRPRLEALVAA